MRGLALALQWIIRVLWVINVALGILFWTGHLQGLVMLHETLGLVIAICLIILSIMGLSRARAAGLGIAGIVVALLLPVVGLGQLNVLPGDNHYIVEVIHLLVGIAAIALAEVLAARYLRETRVGRG